MARYESYLSSLGPAIDGVEGTTSVSDPRRMVICREDFPYASCYCEENIWMLCSHIARGNTSSTSPGGRERLKRFNVVFISNPSKSVLLFHPKSGKSHVVWDYHVILTESLVRCNDSETTASQEDGHSSPVLVWDFDTALSFPCPLKDYLTGTFVMEGSPFGRESVESIKKRYRSCFRVINGVDYLDWFSSSREHMIRDSGEWAMPPPLWPIIQAKQAPPNTTIKTKINEDADGGVRHTLPYYWDTTSKWNDVDVETGRLIMGELMENAWLLWEALGTKGRHDR
eukprot:TRINITY_DN9122_c0_g1_i1.p1 TRINITY_DN9122_c0_g1~~TRINITY_DN9122_c0_g1_i1.p1  ORF type:complete len:284 (+),score=36.56 TRINITY_DN9122_c0_g1_i1:148-999(+)